MSTNDRRTVEKIREKYTPTERTRLDELKTLDKRVRRPAEIFAYIFGTLGTLVLGLGMCLAMEVIGDMMIVGIAIGLVGIGLVSLTYPIYKKILASRRAKHSARIFELSGEILAGSI